MHYVTFWVFRLLYRERFFTLTHIIIWHCSARLSCCWEKIQKKRSLTNHRGVFYHVKCNFVISLALPLLEPHLDVRLAARKLLRIHSHWSFSSNSRFNRLIVASNISSIIEAPGCLFGCILRNPTRHRLIWSTTQTHFTFASFLLVLKHAETINSARPERLRLSPRMIKHH